MKKKNQVNNQNPEDKYYLDPNNLMDPVWEKQDKETTESYLMFRDFLRFDGKIKTLCAHLGFKIGTVEYDARVRSLYQIALRMLWQKRRDAWLLNEEKLKQENYEREKKKKLNSIEKNMFIAEQTVINILTDFVKRLNEKQVSFDKVDPEKQYQIALKAVDQLGKISEMARKALGETTENIKQTIEIKNGLENLQTIVVKASHSSLLDTISLNDDE